MWQIHTEQPMGGSVCCDAHYVVYQSLMVSVHTDIYKLCLENYFLDLDVNGNVLLDIGIK